MRGSTSIHTDYEAVLEELLTPIAGAENQTRAQISEAYNVGRKDVDVFDQREKNYDPHPGKAKFFHVDAIVFAWLVSAASAKCLRGLPVEAQGNTTST